jgi:hypothetical protein
MMSNILIAMVFVADCSNSMLLVTHVGLTYTAAAVARFRMSSEAITEHCRFQIVDFRFFDSGCDLTQWAKLQSEVCICQLVFLITSFRSCNHGILHPRLLK